VIGGIRRPVRRKGSVTLCRIVAFVMLGYLMSLSSAIADLPLAPLIAFASILPGLRSLESAPPTAPFLALRRALQSTTTGS
jgi:hypothetical protein